MELHIYLGITNYIKLNSQTSGIIAVKFNFRLTKKLRMSPQDAKCTFTH